MNKANLKSYAPQARKDFIAAVTARAHLLGLAEQGGQLEVAPAQTQGDVTLIAGQPWPAKINSQRNQLIARMRQHGFAATVEAIAYTWFNRFAALRYMELHDYLGHGHRALSSNAASAGVLPDLLTHAADLAQTTSLPGLNAAQVLEMKLAGNRDGELYRLLLVAQCNALSHAMPFLFERIDDDTELLLPDNLLRTDSIIAKLVVGVPEEDWQEIEVIGWLYQFYISEKKDQVIGKVVKSEDIPAATQLFTPNWIVQYLVQNSVGRLWLMANPASTLASQWPYYIAPAEQTPEVQAQLDALIQTRIAEDGDTLNPETITVLDPACGSGHILVVAYDVLKAIYLERGYRLRDIPRLILEKNLYGLDIDDRAAQLAGFALLMKARADDRRLLADESNPPRLNILSLQESQGLDADALCTALAPVGRVSPQGVTRQAEAEWASTDLFPATHPQMTLGDADSLPLPLGEGRGEGGFQVSIHWLIKTFAHAKTFGSLIEIAPQRLPILHEQLLILTNAQHTGDLYAQAAAKDLLPLVRQALVLGMQFDAVVANPPYMGNKFHIPEVKEFLKSNFKGFEKDLFSAFIVRSQAFSLNSGFTGFMSPMVWMFISSYQKLRHTFLRKSTLSSLVQLEYNASGEVRVPLCCFIMGKQHVQKFTGTYIRLTDFPGEHIQGPKVLEAVGDPSCSWRYDVMPDDFWQIPGHPVAYWISKKVRATFIDHPTLGENSDIRQGMATTDNGRFIRYWYEIPHSQICFSGPSLEYKWFPYNKGGDFRKWYGNNQYVLCYKDGGSELIDLVAAKYPKISDPEFVIKNRKYYYRESASWSDVTSSTTAARYIPKGFIFDTVGPSIFPKENGVENVNVPLGLINSKVCNEIIPAINPTLHFNLENAKSLPLPNSCLNDPRIIECVEKLITLTKDDWDIFETSWDFSISPFVAMTDGTHKMGNSWQALNDSLAQRMSQVSLLESENNQLFISAYGLQDELTPEVPESQITLTRADREKDCQRLVSYAIGCMMGRYSLDAPALIYAHAGNVGFDASRYPSFPADADGILPVTDQPWFADDAPTRIREFLRAVWGEATLEENLAWLAESLGQKSTGGASETPNETIRRYIADKFFKDHLQTYKKRPIYWLFSSGKQGAFQALVYLHRYHEGTLARLRAEYVVPLTGKMQARIDMLQKDAQAASSTAARNKLNKEVEKLKKKHVELLAYDEQLRHYADMRITLDLDDGVKVNYGKFGDLLEGVKVVTGGAGDD